MSDSPVLRDFGNLAAVGVMIACFLSVSLLPALLKVLPIKVKVVNIDGNNLIPYYAQMSQVSIDLQGIIGDWLWKLESLYRDSKDHHTGVVAEFEYTIMGSVDSAWNLGLISEYVYDSRGNNAQNIGQNDLFLGTRWVANDAEGTEILIGFTQDLDNHDVYNARVEASSRINNSWKWRIDGWLIQDDTPTDLLYFARKDDFIEFAIEYYY